MNNPRNRRVAHSLLLANRQLYTEDIEYYYVSHHFRLPTYEIARRWYGGIHPKLHASVKSFEFLATRSHDDYSPDWHLSRRRRRLPGYHWRWEALYRDCPDTRRPYSHYTGMEWLERILVTFGDGDAVGVRALPTNKQVRVVYK